jgi:hypothetical protein
VALLSVVAGAIAIVWRESPRSVSLIRTTVELGCECRAALSVLESLGILGF